MAGRSKTKEADAAPADAGTGYSFSAALDAKASSPGRKGERTRARILATTSRLLEADGLRGLTHVEVCRAADIAPATFYLYFENKSVLCQTVLAQYLTFMQDWHDPRLQALQRRADTSDRLARSIYVANLHALLVIGSNPGLTRCLLQTVGETDEIVEMWRDLSDTWAERSARRAHAVLGGDPALLRQRTRLATGMFDDFVKTNVVDRRIGASIHSPAELVEAAGELSRAWLLIIGSGEHDFAQIKAETQTILCQSGLASDRAQP